MFTAGVCNNSPLEAESVPGGVQQPGIVVGALHACVEPEQWRSCIQAGVMEYI